MSVKRINGEMNRRWETKSKRKFDEMIPTHSHHMLMVAKQIHKSNVQPKHAQPKIILFSEAQFCTCSEIQLNECFRIIEHVYI